MSAAYGQIPVSPLFSGLTEQETEAVLGCVSGRRQAFTDGQTVLGTGERTDAFALVLSGRLRADGSADEMGPGTVCGHTAADTGMPLSVNVTAVEAAEVLFLDVGRVFATCMSACPYHLRLIRNFRLLCKDDGGVLTP